MIHRRWCMAAVLILSAAQVEAGKVYGSLLVDGNPVPEGKQVVINCSGNTSTAKVKQHGRYSVNLNTEGPCTLSVTGYPGATIKLVSYNEATRYNFLLKRSGSSYKISRK